MTQDDIIKLAREAGFEDHSNPELWDCMVVSHEAVKRFAALVAQPLQERIQLLYEQLDEAEKRLDAHYQMGVEAEREACARVCDVIDDGREDLSFECAAAIRARGNHA